MRREEEEVGRWEEEAERWEEEASGGGAVSERSRREWARERDGRREALREGRREPTTAGLGRLVTGKNTCFNSRVMH